MLSRWSRPTFFSHQAAALPPLSSGTRSEYRFHHEHILGMPLDLTAFTPSGREAECCEAAVLRRIHRLGRGAPAVDSLVRAGIVWSAAQAALDAAAGLTGLLLSVGGDMVVAGDYWWSVSVVDPAGGSDRRSELTTLSLKDCAVATGSCSGQGATVVAADNVTANALMIELCRISPREGLMRVACTPGAEAMVNGQDGSEWRSPGFPLFEDTRTTRIPTSGAWRETPVFAALQVR